MSTGMGGSEKKNKSGGGIVHKECACYTYVHTRYDGIWLVVSTSLCLRKCNDRMMYVWKWFVDAFTRGIVTAYFK